MAIHKQAVVQVPKICLTNQIPSLGVLHVLATFMVLGIVLLTPWQEVCQLTIS